MLAEDITKIARFCNKNRKMQKELDRIPYGDIRYSERIIRKVLKNCHKAAWKCEWQSNNLVNYHAWQLMFDLFGIDTCRLNEEYITKRLTDLGYHVHTNHNVKYQIHVSWGGE